MLKSRLSKSLLIFFGIISLSGCLLLEPYEPELGQGNFIREDQLEELSLGQTQEQVSFLLGTPLLTGEQPQERWIYTTYSDAEGYRRLLVSFTDGLVSNIKNDTPVAP